MNGREYKADAATFTDVAFDSEDEAKHAAFVISAKKWCQAPAKE